MTVVFLSVLQCVCW